MRGKRLLSLLLLALALHATAREVRFEEGIAEWDWERGEILRLEIRLAEIIEPADASATWVITVLADRFADGIFAWQLHYSQEFEDARVIPNDFLTIRSFTFSQLGIEVANHTPGLELSLRIPRYGAVPNLIVPGDVIEVHALWVQQAPLVSLAVPGAVVVARDGVGEAVSGEEPSTRPLPSRLAYVQGETIRHRFVLVDPESGAPTGGIAASYSLLRVHEDAPPVFERFGHIPQDPLTAVLAYEIETATLREGRYELIVSTSVDEAPVSTELEIVSSSEGE